jgi:hypothetical protein
MQNVNTISRLDQDFMFFSLVPCFAISLILCTGKYIKLFTGTVTFSDNFQLRLKFQENKVTIRKSVKYWSRNNININIYFVFVHDFCLRRTWEYIRSIYVGRYMRAAHTLQTNLYICISCMNMRSLQATTHKIFSSIL